MIPMSDFFLHFAVQPFDQDLVVNWWQFLLSETPS
jgi:hypothetical protein